MKITFSNGSVVRCTDYHKWLLSTGKRVEAKELKVNDILASFALPDLEGKLTPKLQQPVHITQIEISFPEETYCLTEPKNNTFIANGVLTGNCAEIILRPNSLCNLSEVILRPNDSFEMDILKVQSATIIGMIQAKLTDYHFIDNETIKNQEEECLLGVSLTGILDCPQYNDMKSNKIRILKDEVEKTVDK